MSPGGSSRSEQEVEEREAGLLLRSGLRLALHVVEQAGEGLVGRLARAPAGAAVAGAAARAPVAPAAVAVAALVPR